MRDEAVVVRVIIVLVRDWQDFSVMGQIVNLLDFICHIVSVTTNSVIIA